MLQKKKQKTYQSRAQYFSFNLIKKIRVCYDYRVKKYGNKIGIIQFGNNQIFMNYYENNEEVSSITLAYESEQDFMLSNQNSFNSLDSEWFQSNQCFFCGKLEYLFYYKCLEKEIVQYKLKNLICKTYNFEKRSPFNFFYSIKGIKNTNFIIIIWEDINSTQYLIEIRDSTELQITYVFQQTCQISKILWSNLSKSLIAFSYQQSQWEECFRVKYFSIREQNIYNYLNFHGNFISKIMKIIEMDNYFIMAETQDWKSKPISLTLKGKISFSI